VYVLSPPPLTASSCFLLSASPVSSFLASPVLSTSSPSPSPPPLASAHRLSYVFAVLAVLVARTSSLPPSICMHLHLYSSRYRRLTASPQSPSSSLPASHGTARWETRTSEGSRHPELPKLEESGRHRAKRARGEEEDRRWRNNKRDGQNGVMEGEKDI